ncbi:hypothetical protein [Actinophytocola glycyrrhizae]|uniref:Uncharacterized protein n=1 Tax=Actinophytocola glycyrrhizae TaxID=2044873 RepID=A0ABV9S0I7_9PSEU
MDIDPRTNVVVFQLRRGKEKRLVGRVPTLAEDGVRQAWDAVEQSHNARARHVVGLHTEWEPTPADAAFIADTFPEVTATHHFVRPGPDGWEDAFAAARVVLQAELRPVLRSDSPQLADLPHWPVAAGRLLLALAVVTPSGVYPVTHEQLGDVSFDVLMADVCRENSDFSVETRDDGVVTVSGRLVAAVTCLPGFYQRLTEVLDTERLVAGVLSPDLVHVADADGELAEVVEQAVRAAGAPADAELAPCLLSIVGDQISVLVEDGG